MHQTQKILDAKKNRDYALIYRYIIAAAPDSALRPAQRPLFIGKSMPSTSSSAQSASAGPIRVAIAGLGRSGWDIHAKTLANLTDRFRVVAVLDDRADRRAQAQEKFCASACSDFSELIDNPAVELVIVATPSHLHAAQTIAALDRGKHVLCEKPMALNQADASAMIAAARRNNRLLTVFQNRRFDPHFEQVQRVLKSGALGRIVEIRFTFTNFARRWDWQTLKEFGGGSLNNMGSHFLDQLLVFFPNQLPSVYCFMDRALTFGDAEDHCVMLLRTSGAPLVQLELSSACAYPQDNWLILGTAGTLHGTLDELHWKVAQFSPLPVTEPLRTPTPDRSYNADKIAWTEHSWRVPPESAPIQYTQRLFYESLFESVRHGAPLVVQPEQVLKQLQVLDAARASAATEPPQVK